jgi:hypothetical protein
MAILGEGSPLTNGVTDLFNLCVKFASDKGHHYIIIFPDGIPPAVSEKIALEELSNGPYTSFSCDINGIFTQDDKMNDSQERDARMGIGFSLWRDRDTLIREINKHDDRIEIMLQDGVNGEIVAIEPSKIISLFGSREHDD